MTVETGLYKHYKGNVYAVYFTAKHTETGEELVCYRSYLPNELTDKHDYWCRPASMFLETVLHNDQEVPRFRKLSFKELEEMGVLKPKVPFTE